MWLAYTLRSSDCKKNWNFGSQWGSSEKMPGRMGGWFGVCAHPDSQQWTLVVTCCVEITRNNNTLDDSSSDRTIVVTTVHNGKNVIIKMKIWLVPRMRLLTSDARWKKPPLVSHARPWQRLWAPTKSLYSINILMSFKNFGTPRRDCKITDFWMNMWIITRF